MRIICVGKREGEIARARRRGHWGRATWNGEEERTERHTARRGGGIQLATGAGHTTRDHRHAKANRREKERCERER